jgi:membrane protein
MAAFFASSLLFQAVVGLAARLLPGENPALQSASGVLITVGTWMLGTMTIVLIFRVLPYSRVAWRNALIGGVTTGVLVGLGTSLIGWYVSRFATTSLSGAAASVVLFLVWVYYLAQIVLGGGVLTKVLDDRSP